MSWFGAGAAHTVAVAGPVPVAEAWERYLDVARWPEWSPQIHSVETASSRLVPGMSGTVRTVLPVAVPFTVETVDATRHAWSWRVGTGSLTVLMEHEVVPRDRGCVATLTVHAPLPLAFGYGQVTRLALHRLVH
ncbi:SRPBCC family protein [Desertihabitans aurantiacus]|uniref:SRPBCC family protein n=1 Tax=Desertihabitans aurantiacus TaxID=2282477 RepID=UPI000DF785B9|nr:SRPBCC family protein [Desertihabitans aurantiacus]